MITKATRSTLRRFFQGGEAIALSERIKRVVAVLVRPPYPPYRYSQGYIRCG